MTALFYITAFSQYKYFSLIEHEMIGSREKLYFYSINKRYPNLKKKTNEITLLISNFNLFLYSLSVNLIFFSIFLSSLIEVIYLEQEVHIKPLSCNIKYIAIK